MKQFLSLTANGKINAVLATMPFILSVVVTSALLLTYQQDIVRYMELEPNKALGYWTVYGMLPLLVVMVVVNAIYISMELLKKVLKNDEELREIRSR